MKFKIDENLPVEAAPIIRQAGHDATTLLDQGMRGVPDSEIAAVAAGLTPNEIIESYPPLKREDIQATVAYAAELARERIRTIPA